MSVRHVLLLATAEKHGITPTEMLSRNRSAKLVAARTDYMRALRAYGFSYPQIGRWTQRDHSTVIHHVQRAEREDAWRSFGEIAAEVVADVIERGGQQ